MENSTQSTQEMSSMDGVNHNFTTNPFLSNSKDLDAVQQISSTSLSTLSSTHSSHADVFELNLDQDNVSLNSNDSRSNTPPISNDLQNHSHQKDHPLETSISNSFRQSTPFTKQQNQRVLAEEHLPRFQINDEPFEPDASLDNVLDFRYLLASAHLSDACQGLDSQFVPDRNSLRLYAFYQRPLFRQLLYALLIIHHSLALFEPITAHDRLITLPSSPSVQYTMLIEMCCLSYYGLLLALRARFLPPIHFYSDRKNLLVLCTLLLTLVDMLLFVAVPAPHARRWSIPLRPLFVINLAQNRPIRRAIRNIRHTLPDIGSVLFLFAMSIGLFAAVANRLFRQIKFTTSDGQSANGFLDFCYLLYVLVTTANNPDLMMPAYKQNRFYALFFVLFLIVNLYLFMNLMLATIYSNYRKHLKNEVILMQNARHHSLRRCVESLQPGKRLSSFNESSWQSCTVTSKPSSDVQESSANRDLNQFFCLSRMQFERLLYAYFRNWQTATSSNDHLQPLVQLLWALLQTDQVVPESKLPQLVELLNMRMQLKPESQHSCLVRKTRLDDHRRDDQESDLYTISKWWQQASDLLRRCVQSMRFRQLFDALILLNAILIAFDCDWLPMIEWPLLLLFAFELAAKLFTFGLRCFMSKYWNLFDCAVIGSALLLAAFIWFLKFYRTVNPLPVWLLPSLDRCVDILLILRVLRLCKLGSRVPRFGLAMSAIRRLLPHLVLYATLLLLLLYSYAILGMQAFSGLIDDRTLANNCTLATGRTIPYCEINFNTLPSSMLLLFNLIVVNQWHVFADHYVMLSASRLIRLYFVSFHLLCVLIVLNIFTAFVLEAFSIEYTTLRGDHLEQSLRDRIAQLYPISFPSSCKTLASRKKVESDKRTEDVETAPGDDADRNANAQQLDADHEQMQWIQVRNLVDTSVDNAGECPQRLQLLIRPKNSVETLLLKMFSSET